MLGHWVGLKEFGRGNYGNFSINERWDLNTLIKRLKSLFKKLNLIPSISLNGMVLYPFINFRPPGKDLFYDRKELELASTMSLKFTTNIFLYCQYKIILYSNVKKKDTNW